ncbi:hypothetical protein ACFY93_13465 [Streptomyces sp. NPDC008313]|uniref:hypothetical protein n=1 Tax=Streptomyces sp. NPDC008313 TaxID=3364826 RepID=UPI0036E1FB17
MAHIHLCKPLTGAPTAVYLRCHPYDRWQMALHRTALLQHAENLSLPTPDIFFDNGCLSRAPLPQLDRLLSAIEADYYKVLLLPGPFVLSLDDRKARDLTRWIRSRGCQVEELPATHPQEGISPPHAVARPERAPGRLPCRVSN